jgi:hypothetical protein
MSPYEELIQMMVQNGIPEDEARAAATRCAARVGAAGALGWATGSLLAPFLGMGAVATAAGGAIVGSAHTFLTSPSCSEVRRATDHWLKQGIGN